jgi:hypothetical protein
MSTGNNQSLWSRLRAAGIVDGDMPQAGAAPSPWYLRVMLGIAGWIAALFLLAFVAMGFSFVLKSASSSLFAGLLCCAVAAGMFRATPDGDFATQFALAVSLAGQGLLLAALLLFFPENSVLVALGIAAVQASLFVAVPNDVHRVWSVWAACCALAYALAKLHALALAPAALAVVCALIWWRESHRPAAENVRRAAGYGVVLALMSVTVLANVMHGGWLWPVESGAVPARVVPLWLSGVVAGAVLVWVVQLLLRRHQAAPRAQMLLLVLATVPALAAPHAPGLAPALLVLLLGVAGSNRALLGLGVVFLLSYLSLFYYSLGSTLLEKSALMMATGVVLLLARTLVLRVWPAYRSNAHA